MKTMDSTVWEVTNPVTAPVMFCAHANGNHGADAEYAVIRALLAKAKREKVSVHSITLTLDEEAKPVATLTGTRDERYKS